jgi:hypothetical protein
MASTRLLAKTANVKIKKEPEQREAQPDGA